MASKKINYTALDFDEQKTSLQTFLQGQTIFSDYDFEGSGLSVLLDVLTYNTHYNAIYNNLSINEMFLDSARKRNSVVSIAKELGYTPNSAICATATVDITFNSVTASLFTLPANTPFNTIVNGVNYTFYNASALASVSPEVSHTFSNVVITEKSNQLSFKYTAASGVSYIIPNQYADLSTLSVTIQDNISSSNLTTFTLADNIVNITNASTVYWIKEIDNGLYELTFGNGIIGLALVPGNIVSLNYCISSLGAPNGARVFSYNGSLPQGVTTSIRTTSKATNGSGSEDIESIRFNAPRAHSAQNRGVTTSDYKSILMSNFPDAHSVSVWGGEDNIPPVYGKVFISIKPKSTDILTTAQKNYILNTLLPSKNVLTVFPVIVDPEHIKIMLTTTVYFNPLNTIRTPTDIQNMVLGTILNYNSTDLQVFDGVFRYSHVSKLIDSSEDSIINNITTVTFKRAIAPKYNIIAQYFVNLINPIYSSGVANDSVLSSGFYTPDNNFINYVVDDGIGNIQLFHVNENNFRVYTNQTLGTVDYNKGTISFKNLNITSIVGNAFYLYIKPSSNDIISALTQILEISQEDLKVNVVSDTSSSGDLRGGQNYTFTTSRS